MSPRGVPNRPKQEEPKVEPEVDESVQDLSTKETVDNAINEKHTPAGTPKEKKIWTRVKVQPIGIDAYELTYYYGFEGGDKEFQEDPVEVTLWGGKGAINKRAAEGLRAKRLREELADTGWFITGNEG